MATGSCTHLRLNGIKESRKEEKRRIHMDVILITILFLYIRREYKDCSATPPTR